MAATKAVEVHCANCGADWWTKISALGTLVGLLVATAAFVVAIRANTTSKDSLDIAQDQLAISRAEHEDAARRSSASSAHRMPSGC